MIRTISSAACVAASIVASAAIAHGATTSTTSPVITWISNRPCATEDAVNCAWNASERGNGRGHSFVVRAFPGRRHLVCVMYDERRYAATHDYCEVTR